MGTQLRGTRFAVHPGETGFPRALETIRKPPRALFVVGDRRALAEGIAVVGARKATPYGIGCAKRFARIAAEKGINVISGGARGCDRAAHEAALDAGGRTLVFLGGGCDKLYPAEHAALFQRVIDAGGAVASEHAWDVSPRPWMFRERNRLIAGLARATLIVEAGLPSGTFSTADEALEAGREVLAVPGAVTAPSSHGANRLIAQGATPIIDDESFEDALFTIFGALKNSESASPADQDEDDPILAACLAEPIGIEAVVRAAVGVVGAGKAAPYAMQRLAELESSGRVARYPDGRYGPV